MVQRMPDELFREGPSGEEAQAKPRRRSRAPKPADEVTPIAPQTGMALRNLVFLVLVLVLASFLVGKFLIFSNRTTAQPIAVPSKATASQAAKNSTNPFQIYDGAVTGVGAIHADGKCKVADAGAPPDQLIDTDPATLWRCKGDGVGETITFAFGHSVDLVGLRIVNGNTVWEDRYLAERRITSIRWVFGDGSYFDQGLAANNSTAQEVRFPKVTTDSVKLIVNSSTEPGEDGSFANAVSISSLEFLSPA